MRVSVVIPTWQRAASLGRCLRALARQSVAPHEVIVVTRTADEGSRAAARQALAHGAAPVRLVLPEVAVAGVVAALCAGVDAASGDVIAFTDDDAEPRTDWVERLAATIAASDRIGGAGGRDHQPGDRGWDVATVGRVQWFGRVIGRHHLGMGAARDVDVLKGVNAAFRASALRMVGFDDRLRGAGAQQHWELALCLPLRRAGWRLVYDPAIAVDHHVEARAGDDQIHRGRFDDDALLDAVHNETLVVLEHLPAPARVVHHAWSSLIGTVAAPGALNALRLRLQGHAWAWRAWRATRAGRRLGREAVRA